MSTAARLAGFAAVLALVFGSAALAGSRLDVHPGRASADAEMGMDEMAQPVRGLAVSAGGLTLELARTAAPRGERFDLAFRITDARGRTVRAFDVEHTKRMHLIVVRRDLTGFQHLHPVQRADGSWSVPATLRAAGAYRVFADFSYQGRPRTLAGDLTVDGPLRTAPLPAPAASAETGGLRVTLSQGAPELGFTVTRAGQPVAVQPYLGAKGHLVALREGDLAFVHVHPDQDRLRFGATFPTAGRYRLFLQFKVGGELHTAAFTKAVAR